ncbi:MAG: AMP-binding protein, partial [Acidimicrobiales bacterium]
MHPGVHASTHPDKSAYVLAGSGRTVTYARLDERSRRLARLLQDRGLGPGDLVAVFMENNEHYLEVVWAAQRSGLLYTTISSRLTAGEVSYILDDAGAAALVTSFAHRQVAAAVASPAGLHTWLMVNGTVEGYEDYEQALSATPPEPRQPELEGRSMLYSSGTTGRP